MLLPAHRYEWKFRHPPLLPVPPPDGCLRKKRCCRLPRKRPHPSLTRLRTQRSLRRSLMRPFPAEHFPVHFFPMHRLLSVCFPAHFPMCPFPAACFHRCCSSMRRIPAERFHPCCSLMRRIPAERFHLRCFLGHFPDLRIFQSPPRFPHFLRRQKHRRQSPPRELPAASIPLPARPAVPD